jgi:uncharacterized protein
MSIEVRPVGVKCNIGCLYCYQNILRDAGWQADARTDLDAIKAAIAARDQPFHLFGGEPLLMREDELEELLRWGCERYGSNTIQTNGSLITHRHLTMFRQYNVRVGISIDGPDALNDARWAGSLEKTRAATRASNAAIHLLCEQMEPPSLMIQLTRCNATGERLERLCEWLGEMHRLGVSKARIHILEIDDPQVRQRFGLCVEENIAAFTRIMLLRKQWPDFYLDCNADKREMLMMQDDDAACVWRACDPHFTDAVQGLGAHGEAHKCGLTDKQGVNFERSEEQSYIRYVALGRTPQEFGGCKGCRFFFACKGQCPGTGINGDWRNRTENCEVFKELFSLAEGELMEEGRTPLSVHPDRARVEKFLLSVWSEGRNPNLSQIRREMGIDLGPQL